MGGWRKVSSITNGEMLLARQVRQVSGTISADLAAGTSKELENLPPHSVFSLSPTLTTPFLSASICPHAE